MCRENSAYRPPAERQHKPMRVAQRPLRRSPASGLRSTAGAALGLDITSTRLIALSLAAVQATVLAIARERDQSRAHKAAAIGWLLSADRRLKFSPKENRLTKSNYAGGPYLRIFLEFA
jgi:hypothetical protein